MNVRGDTVIGVLYAWLTSPRADYARFTSETIDDHEFTLNIGWDTIKSSNVTSYKYYECYFRTFNLNIFSGDMSSSYERLIDELTTDFTKELVSAYTEAIITPPLNEAIQYSDLEL